MIQKGTYLPSVQDNEIGDAGAVALAKALQSNTTLSMMGLVVRLSPHDRFFLA